MTQNGFWRTTQVNNNRATLTGFGELNRVWYIAPQGFGPRGSFTTFTELAPNLRSRDLIYIIGVLREQAVAPLDVYDVSIVGAANQPRQATSGGEPTGGGASWLAPTSPTATTPLLELRAAGWTISNIQFAPVASSACVRLTRSAVTDTIDASHTVFDNCYMVGGGANGIGIEDNGGCGFVTIVNSRFQALGDTAIKSLNTAAAVPLGWQIGTQYGPNRFQQNLNDIKMSLSYGAIENNKFMTAGSGSTNKVISTIAISAQGNNNDVVLNYFHNTTGEIQVSNGYSGSSTDQWANYCTGTAALIVTSPPGA